MINIKNTAYDKAKEKREIEERIENGFKDGKTSVYVPINTNGYHNDGQKIYDTELCREVARECRANGFFTYWSKPSHVYKNFMDLLVTTKPQNETEYRVRVL